jgi:tetratricopeptide (TPR) repeat protein
LASRAIRTIWRDLADQPARGRTSGRPRSFSQAIRRIPKREGRSTEPLWPNLGVDPFPWRSLGEFVAACTLFERCHRLADPRLRAIAMAKIALDPYAEMLAHLAVTLACLGYIDQARSRMNEALSEARRAGLAYTLGEVLHSANAIDRLTRSAELERHSEELLALSTEHGFPTCLGKALIFRALWLIELGQAQEALELLKRGMVTTATGAGSRARSARRQSGSQAAA